MVKKSVNFLVFQSCFNGLSMPLGLIICTSIMLKVRSFREICMDLLKTFDDRDEAEKAEQLIDGGKRLASERDGTETIFNLFGHASWNNLYKLEMYNLPLLQQILKDRANDQPIDEKKYHEIISTLNYAASNFNLEIPDHWL